MNAIFKKLNYKDHAAIYVIDAPASFGSAVDEMRAITAVHDTLAKAKDEDWSALRFRRVDFIKSMTRSSAMTEKGQERVKDHKAKK